MDQAFAQGRKCWGIRRPQQGKRRPRTSPRLSPKKPPAPTSDQELPSLPSSVPYASHRHVPEPHPAAAGTNTHGHRIRCRRAPCHLAPSWPLAGATPHKRVTSSTAMPTPERRATTIAASHSCTSRPQMANIVSPGTCRCCCHHPPAATRRVPHHLGRRPYPEATGFGACHPDPVSLQTSRPSC